MPTCWRSKAGSSNENAYSAERTRAQTLIFGWLSEPEITLDGLTQVAGRREVEITASGLCQRFTQAAADFLQRLLERLTQVRLQAEASPTPLLERLTATFGEVSSDIS